MKYKAKKELPMSGSYCGLDEKVWSQLNSGDTVELEEVPAMAEEYLTKVNNKKTKGDKK
jgi:hypothetical protein|tara:strand:- start:15660 stop:15836 length:177 start_codon:yes stop_codon:yes gene_type:complete